MARIVTMYLSRLYSFQAFCLPVFGVNTYFKIIPRVQSSFSFYNWDKIGPKRLFLIITHSVNEGDRNLNPNANLIWYISQSYP